MTDPDLPSKSGVPDAHEPPGTNDDKVRSAALVPAAFDKHLPLTLTSLAFVVVAVKLLMVSHGDMQTAKAVLAVRGWTSVPSLLMAMLPTLVVATTGLALLDFSERVRERDPLGRLPWALVVLIPASLLVGPRVWIVTYGLMLLVMIATSVLLRFFRKKDLKSRPGYSLKGVFLIFAVVGLLTAVSTPSPWLPLEQVAVDGEAPLTGYVLGEEGSLTALLDDETRTVIWIPTTKVTARATCVQRQWSRAFLPSLIWRGSEAGAPCAVGTERD